MPACTLTGRGLLLIALAAALGIAGLWVDVALLAGLWLAPLALLAGGLALERRAHRALQITADLQHPDPLLLGEDCEFVLRVTGSQRARIEWLPLVPPEFGGDLPVRSLSIDAGVPLVVSLRLLPVQLGDYAWEPSPLRVRVAWGLAEWNRSLPVSGRGRAA